MSLRRLAFGAAAAFGVVFVGIMAWDLVTQRPRLTGNQVCVQDLETAKLLGMEGPGVYMYDRTSGSPVRIPPSMALAMVASFDPPYPDYRKCGLNALRQTRAGLLTIASLAAVLVAAVAGLFLRRS